MIKYAAEKRGFKKFSVLSVDSDYGRAAVDFTGKYLPNLIGEILTEDYYKEGEVDFRSVLAKMRNSGAQAIIMYGNADTTRRGLQTYKKITQSLSVDWPPNSLSP